MQNNFFFLPNNYIIINKAGIVWLAGVLLPHRSVETPECKVHNFR